LAALAAPGARCAHL